MHALRTVLPKQLTDWHEGRSAIRMLVAAVAAYICTTIVHLPGPYSAVITTLIVARPHSGGVLRASVERLTAPILGAGIACAATFDRLLHAPELLASGNRYGSSGCWFATARMPYRPRGLPRRW